MRKTVKGIEVDFEIEETKKVIDNVTASFTIGNVDYYYSFEIGNLELTENARNLDTENETESYFINGQDVNYLDIPVGVIAKIKDVKSSLTENLFLDVIENYGDKKGYGSDFYFLGVSEMERNDMYEHSC